MIVCYYITKSPFFDILLIIGLLLIVNHIYTYSNFMHKVVMLLAIEVLKEIKEAEVAAENVRKQALARSKEIIRNATEESEKELDAANRKAQDLASQIIKVKEDEAGQKANAILESSQKDCEAIKKVPQDKIDKAVNLVIERIVKHHGDS